MLFGYFLHDAKSDNSFPLQGESRFCKPRFSSPQPQLRTAIIKTFLRRDSRFCKPRISAHKQQSRTIQLNPFFALRRCPCRDGTLRVLFRRPWRLFFPPCGGPMLLPQHFSPPCGGSFLAKKQRNDRRTVPLLLLYSPLRRYA